MQIRVGAAPKETYVESQSCLVHVFYVFSLCFYLEDTPSTQPLTSLTSLSSHMPNETLALTPVMHKPMRGDNTKETFSPLQGLSYAYTLPHHSQGSWETLPKIWRHSHSLSHLPTAPCPDWPSTLLRKAGEKAEVPPESLCTDPPSCKHK